MTRPRPRPRSAVARIGPLIPLLVAGGVAAAILAPGNGDRGAGHPRATRPMVAESPEPDALTPLIPASEPGVGPRVGRAARSRMALRSARATAQLRATGGPPEAIEVEVRSLSERTGCRAVARTFVVPRGFSDVVAIRHRVDIEASYYRSQLTRVADWPIQPEAGAGPQFDRVVTAVFLTHCRPPAR